MDERPEFYRYEYYENTWQGMFPSIEITVGVYIGVKQTPCGWWIALKGWWEGREDKDMWKWVSNTAMKRYAYPTRKEAMVNFRKRKQKYVKILEARLALNRRILEQVEKKYESDGSPILKMITHKDDINYSIDGLI